FLRRRPELRGPARTAMRRAAGTAGTRAKGRASPRLPPAEAVTNESVPAIHPAAGGHLTPDGGHFACGLCCVPAAPGLSSAGGRLPDHPGSDLLPRRQPQRDGAVGYGTAGAAVRADPRPAADDVDLVRWRIDHHAGVHAR